MLEVFAGLEMREVSARRRKGRSFCWKWVKYLQLLAEILAEILADFLADKNRKNRIFGE